MHGLSFGSRGAATRLALFICLLSWALPRQASSQSAAPQHTELKLLALGDSLTAGYGLPHELAFTTILQTELDREKLDVRVLDAGVSGDTSADARARLDWTLGDAPQVAIVELGGNDGLRGLAPAQMEQNIDAILNELDRRHIPTLLSGMVAPPNMGGSYGAEFSAVFDRLRHRPGLLYDPFFLQGVAPHENLEQDDHIHPNAAGVQVIVTRLMPLIRRLIAASRAQVHTRG